MRLNQIESRLSKFYGQQKFRKTRTALEILIATILSQNTSDINSSRVYKNLLDRFDSWHSIANADTQNIENAIRAGGLAKSKAKYIKFALQKIYNDFGDYNLQSINQWEVDKSLIYLTALDGIGSKTAACVLLFAFNRKIMPVDTHVHRISYRIGLVSQKKDRQKSFQYYFNQNNIVDYYNLHLNLVKHGRKICHSQKPDCESCVLNSLCDFFRQDKKS